MHAILGQGDDDEQFRRIQPPENEVPAVVPVSTVLARTDGSALTLTGVRVFSTGLGFILALRCRPEALPAGEVDLGSLLWRGRRGAGSELLLGVAIADGRRANHLPGRAPSCCWGRRGPPAPGPGACLVGTRSAPPMARSRSSSPRAAARAISLPS